MTNTLITEAMVGAVATHIAGKKVRAYLRKIPHISDPAWLGLTLRTSDDWAWGPVRKADLIATNDEFRSRCILPLLHRMGLYKPGR